MKKNILLIILVFCIMNPLNAKQNSPTAVIIKSSGVIILQREVENKTTTRNAKSGELLYSGDELFSKEQSIAVIRFVDKGAIIKLFSNSILTINSEKNQNKLDKKLYMEIGDLWSKVTKEKGEYEIRTPTSVAAVKGTDFYTNVQENGETMIVVFEGIVELQTEMGSQNVSKGKTGTAVQDEVPTVEETQESDVSDEIIEEIESYEEVEEETEETQTEEETEETQTEEEIGEIEETEEETEEQVLEIKFENENGEIKTLKIYYSE